MKEGDWPLTTERTIVTSPPFVALVVFLIGACAWYSFAGPYRRIRALNSRVETLERAVLGLQEFTMAVHSIPKPPGPGVGSLTLTNASGTE